MSTPAIYGPSKQHSLIIPTPADTIKQIALLCLKEFVLSLSLTLAVSFFVVSPLALTVLVNAACVQMAVSLVFHGVGAIAKHKGANVVTSLCEWITGANFAYQIGTNAQSLVHESGHALAALSIYKRPRPEITIYPFNGGRTHFYKTTMTPFGKKLGSVGSTCLVVASGPAFALFISAIIFTVGMWLKENHPHFGKYLIAWGLLDFLSHARYAYSAIGSDQSYLMHDFVHLSIFGLHPGIATIAIVATPILIGLGIQQLKSKLCLNRQPVQA